MKASQRPFLIATAWLAFCAIYPSLSMAIEPATSIENLILTPDLLFEPQQCPEVDWRCDQFVARKFANEFADSLVRPGRNLFLVNTSYFGTNHPLPSEPLPLRGWYFENNAKMPFAGAAFAEIALDGRLFRRQLTGASPFEFTRSRAELASWLEEQMYVSGNASLIIQNLVARNKYFGLVRQNEDDARQFLASNSNGLGMMVIPADMGPDHPKIKWLRERVEYYDRVTPIALALQGATQLAQLQASQASFERFRKYSWDEIEVTLAQSYPQILADARLDLEPMSPSYRGSNYWGDDPEFRFHSSARLSLKLAQLAKERTFILSFLMNALSGEEAQWFNPAWVMDLVVPQIQKNPQMMPLLEDLGLEEEEKKFLILYSLLRGMLKVFDAPDNQRGIPRVADYIQSLLRAVPFSRANLPDSYTNELQEQPESRVHTWFLDGLELLVKRRHLQEKSEQIKVLRCHLALEA